MADPAPDQDDILLYKLDMLDAKHLQGIGEGYKKRLEDG